MDVSIFSDLPSDLPSEQEVEDLMPLEQNYETAIDISRNKRDSPDFEYKAEKPVILINKTDSNETSFEDYEKQYLLNKTKYLLEQFLQYGEFLKKLQEHKSESNANFTTEEPPTPLPQGGETTTPQNRVDPLLEAKLRELSEMSLQDLTHVFNNLRRSAEEGVEDPGIASLCCHIG